MERLGIKLNADLILKTEPPFDVLFGGAGAVHRPCQNAEPHHAGPSLLEGQVEVH